MHKPRDLLGGEERSDKKPRSLQKVEILYGKIARRRGGGGGCRFKTFKLKS